jgi:hypothetical protein
VDNTEAQAMMNAWRFMAGSIGLAALAFAVKQAVLAALLVRRWVWKQGGENK